MAVKKEDMFGDATLRMDELQAPAPAGLHLFVFGEGVQGSFSLPDKGEAVIGRGDQADIVIDDPSISRRHVMLTLGDTVKVCDLGSSNGTRVRDEPLEAGAAVEVALGETFDFGSCHALVQKKLRASIRPYRVGTHGYFESRLEEECGRAKRTHAPVAILRLRISGNPVRRELHERMTSALRPGDLLATYGPNDYEVLLPDTPAEDAVAIADALVAAIESLKGEGQVGLACFPRDGRTAGALIGVATDRLLGGDDNQRRVVIEDDAMRELYTLAERIAKGTISVLVLGETGVGKEVLAETIHRRSDRVDKPFVRLNCAALTETLLESELFGHEKGAFTGAVQAKTGLLESADGGTAFLDEAGELPLSTQVKLLRVLEERVVLPVGSIKPRKIDVRFVAATNANLEELVLSGAFRQDLYYRLNGISIVIPPLRERPNEIEALAHQFIADAAERAGLQHAPEVSTAALMRLRSYAWPGNIRELRNVMERAVLLADDKTIEVDHLPVDKMDSTLLAPALPTTTTAPVPARAPSEPTLPAGDLRGAVEEVEKQRILDTLDECAGNQTRAAKQLGISRTTLLARLDAYGIPRPRKKKS